MDRLKQTSLTIGICPQCKVLVGICDCPAGYARWKASQQRDTSGTKDTVFKKLTQRECLPDSSKGFQCTCVGAVSCNQGQTQVSIPIASYLTSNIHKDSEELARKVEFRPSGIWRPSCGPMSNIIIMDQDSELPPIYTPLGRVTNLEALPFDEIVPVDKYFIKVLQFSGPSKCHHLPILGGSEDGPTLSISLAGEGQNFQIPILVLSHGSTGLGEEFSNTLSAFINGPMTLDRELLSDTVCFVATSNCKIMGVTVEKGEAFILDPQFEQTGLRRYLQQNPWSATKCQISTTYLTSPLTQSASGDILMKGTTRSKRNSPPQEKPPNPTPPPKKEKKRSEPLTRVFTG